MERYLQKLFPLGTLLYRTLGLDRLAGFISQLAEADDIGCRGGLVHLQEERETVYEPWYWLVGVEPLVVIGGHERWFVAAAPSWLSFQTKLADCTTHVREDWYLLQLFTKKPS